MPKRLASIEDFLTQEGVTEEIEDSDSEDFDEEENLELLVLYTDSTFYVQPPVMKLEAAPPLLKIDSVVHTPIQNLRKNISCDDFELKKKQFDSGNSADPLFMDFEIP